ncbi:Uncharacterized protein PHSC3_001184 [Chlamydiales bacterium STE3]|nr:Uncharacterized protein PHSC3_001184 [Chlamydiales bacterium STE3]
MNKKARAKESQKIQKARQKLERKLQAEQKKFTTEALKEVSRRIQLNFARHYPEETYLQDRNFKQFDKNHPTAKIKSHHIIKMKELLESSEIL